MWRERSVAKRTRCWDEKREGRGRGCVSTMFGREIDEFDEKGRIEVKMSFPPSFEFECLNIICAKDEYSIMHERSASLSCERMLSGIGLPVLSVLIIWKRSHCSSLKEESVEESSLMVAMCVCVGVDRRKKI